jgi:pimeloyl-ACP methyl ester carboxylesterase
VTLFGTSFGGGHAVAVAAARSDLAAVIAQFAVVDCLATARRSPPLLALKWGIAGTIDAARALVGRSPNYIKLAGQPGEVALMSEAGAEEAYLSMIDGPSPWQNRIAARIALALPFYRPILKAANVRAPLLMVVCDRDEVCPPSAAAKVARLAPRGSTAHFDSGHFDIYFGALFDKATKAMLEFLASSKAAPRTTQQNRAVLAEEEAL